MTKIENKKDKNNSNTLSFLIYILSGQFWFKNTKNFDNNIETLSENNNVVANITEAHFYFDKLKKHTKNNIDKAFDSGKIEYSEVINKREIELENKNNEILFNRHNNIIENSDIVKNNNKPNHNKENYNLKIDNISESDIENDILHSQYVPLTIENITVNALYIKHKILLKYINIKEKMYIKSIVFKNIDMELGCYNNGENKEIIFRKKSDSLLQIIAKEKNGKEVSVFVVNGKIVD